jgi:hypothetical protein
LKVASSGGTPIPLTPEDKVVFGYSFHLETDRVAIVYNEPANMGDLYDSRFPVPSMAKNAPQLIIENLQRKKCRTLGLFIELCEMISKNI